MHKTQVQIDQRPQYKASHTEPYRREMGNTLEHIGTGDHFLNIISVAQTLGETVNKWDILKLRSFCKTKDIVNKTKWQPTEWEKIFTNPTSDRGLISKIYKDLRNLVTKRTHNPI